jgi:hypothetical protein
MSKEVKLDGEAREHKGSVSALENTLFLDVTEVARQAGFHSRVMMALGLVARCLSICMKDGDMCDEERVWRFLLSLRSSSDVPQELANGPWACSFCMNECQYGVGRIKVVRLGETEA